MQKDDHMCVIWFLEMCHYFFTPVSTCSRFLLHYATRLCLFFEKKNDRRARDGETTVAGRREK